MLLRDKSRSESKVRVWMWMIFLVLLFASVSGAYIAQSAAGLPNSPNWFNEDDSLQADSTKDVTWDELWREEHNCRQNDITVVEHGTGRSTLTQGCVVDGVSARIALNVAGSRYHHISIGLDEKFYPIINVNANTMTLRFFSNSDRFLMIGHALGEVLTGTFMAMYDDIGSRLHYVDGGAYSLDTTNSLIFPGTDQAKLFVKGYGFSPDGTYLVYGREHQESYAGDRITKVNLETGEHKIIGIGYKAVWWNPGRAEYGISDNGDYVVSNNFIWDTRDCGVNIVDDSYALENPCAKRRPYACARLDDCSPRYVRFEGMYKFKVIVGNSNLQEATYVVDNYDDGRLEYLAMGDSYSSGEGDIGRKDDGSSYYLPVTGGAKGCHLSTRSYPFLLRQAWGIPEDKMKSVACSGAQVLPDYYGRLESYFGQGGRLKDVKDIATARDVALQKFIPGRIPQIEFVRKYQPRVITLTGGGNDVGFGRILKDCATPNAIDFISDCSYAKEGSATHEVLLGSIRMQYLVTKRLISNIKEVSPGSKIIIVGYPIFISTAYDGPATCRPNIGNLSMRERKAINRMTSQLNDALQQAAHEMQVSFVNTEESLVGGRLCEGSEYMTGVWDWIGGRAVDDERFHPNAAGHQRISQAVENSGVYSGEKLPPSKSLGFIDNATKAFRFTIIEGGIILRGTTTKLRVESEYFAPHTTYSATAYSTPKELGIFQTGADGSVQQDISFDGLEPGYHMLVLEGVGVDGEPLKLYQYIEVNASKKDADGDGIPDDKDRCHFMSYLYDGNGRDICKVADDTRSIDEHASFNKSLGTPVADTDTDATTEGQPIISKAGELDTEDEPKDGKYISPKEGSGSILIISSLIFAIVAIDVVVVVRRQYIMEKE